MTDPEEPQAPEEPGPLAVGDVVADRYRIDGVLGEGGMGIVYRAEHLHLRKLQALKVLLPAWSSMPEIVARFEREAVAAGNIASPHVAAATDFGRLPDGSFFLVMEYVKGRTLRDALDAGALGPARALHIVRGIASALQAAHALGIVHRDMKPENIMLVERGGDPLFVKVLDFGIARVDAGGPQGGGGKALTRAGAILGTPDYMSPEQALGEAVDARSDLYSVGVILFEMLTGDSPFSGSALTVLRERLTGEVPELPADIAADVDPRLAAVVRRLLARDRNDRFASATDLLAALDDAPPPESIQGTTTPVSVQPATPVLVHGGVRAAVQGATRRQLMAASIGVAVVATTIVTLVTAGGTHTPTPAAAGPSTEPAAVVVSGTASTSLAPAEIAKPAPVLVLPPPPAVSSPPATARPSASGPRPASSQGQSRRTGPGGIYIPPPSQWFK